MNSPFLNIDLKNQLRVNIKGQKILKYYNIKLPKSNTAIKSKANSILANHLCRCIKKIGLKNEPKSIAICTKSVINNKGISRGSFTCKKNQSIHLKFRPGY